MKKNFQEIKEKLILHKLVNFNNFMIKKTECERNKYIVKKMPRTKIKNGRFYVHARKKNILNVTQ